MIGLWLGEVCFRSEVETPVIEKTSGEKLWPTSLTAVPIGIGMNYGVGGLTNLGVVLNHDMVAVPPEGLVFENGRVQRRRLLVRRPRLPGLSKVGRVSVHVGSCSDVVQRVRVSIDGEQRVAVVGILGEDERVVPLANSEHQVIRGVGGDSGSSIAGNGLRVEWSDGELIDTFNYSCDLTSPLPSSLGRRGKKRVRLVVQGQTAGADDSWVA